MSEATKRSTFTDMMRKIEVAVMLTAAELGLEIHGELRGLIGQSGMDGVGFHIQFGDGVPPNWSAHNGGTGRT